eukprot:TRINITY_DN11888_c0_g1_i1.p1 TRINITY_DN11888_c0_g1~~TRINITY_DN11888_c0_g1_i1.p1  ORF type:complete len:261 (-),score=68.39 TRINITY_DN11888_c0_g1_i1:113-895(-)
MEGEESSEREEESSSSSLMRIKKEHGTCRVVCFSPQHNVTLADMSEQDIEGVIYCWISQTDELMKKEWVNHVQIFENKGAMMGCSNPHPHCQIWAQESIPNVPKKEMDSMMEFEAAHGCCLLCRYVAIECSSKERIVFENDSWVVVVPFWATWPFETLVLPKKHIGTLKDMDEECISGFAQALSVLTQAYDRLFDCSFPYSSGIHQAPQDCDAFHLHMHFFPPLLRSATVKKHMVGYELMAEQQRDLTAETASKFLLAKL